MIGRVVEVAEDGRHLALKRGFMQLKADGANFDASDFTLGLQINDRDGVAVTLVGSFAYLDQAAGTVRVSLDAADLPLKKSAYRVRFTITDVASKIAFIPNGRDPDIWQIVAVP